MDADTAKGVAFCFIFGGGMMWRAIHRWKKSRKIEDTPCSRVATAPQGYVELQGFAWPAGSTVRNGEGEDLVYYSLKIERAETRGSGKSKRKQWVSVFQHLYAEPFYLVDATGLAFIDPRASELDTGEERKRKWASLSSPEKARVLEIVGSHRIAGFPPTSFLGIFGGDYRIVEKEIHLGSPLYAHGDFRALAATPPRVDLAGLREFHSRVFDAKTRGLRNVDHLLDRDRDGKVTAEESKRGYAIAARLARSKRGENPAVATETAAFEVWGKVGSSADHKLFVADLHERYLVGRLNRHLWIQFAAGAALITLGLAGAVPSFFGVSNPLRSIATERR